MGLFRFWSHLQDKEKEELFRELNKKQVELQNKLDFLQNKNWEELWTYLKGLEQALLENLLVCKDPYESFSLRGQVLGIRQLLELKKHVADQLQSVKLDIEQLVNEREKLDG